MAIVQKETIKGITHEVRSAGNSIRLYTDGVFHSQFNPLHPVGGHLWDLLMLPMFFVDPEKVRRVLVLGAGGGAVMRQLAYFTSKAEIIGVDNNQWHLAAARKYFGIQGPPFRLYEADAVEWVSQYSGDRFDLVIDDLYGECEGEPSRAVDTNELWFKCMSRLLKPMGVLAINFLDHQSLVRSSWYNHRVNRKIFPSAFRLNMDNYENIVGVFCKSRCNQSDFNNRLRQYPELDLRRKSCKLNFKIRNITNV